VEADSNPTHSGCRKHGRGKRPVATGSRTFDRGSYKASLRKGWRCPTCTTALGGTRTVEAGTDGVAQGHTTSLDYQ
jgi:hypothetical protein